MYSDIILREGEMVLKGRNRRDFEYRLIKNVKRQVKEFGVTVERSYGRVYIRNANENTTEIIKRMKLIPGIYNMSPIVKTDKNIDNIKALALDLLTKAIGDKKTLK